MAEPEGESGMSETPLPTTVPTPDPRLTTGTARRGLLGRLLRNPVGLVSLGFLILIVLSAAFAPLLTHYGPDSASLSDVLAPMGGKHPLGADGSGRDVLARLLYGGRVSLAGALLASAIAAALGVTAGLVAGYYGGRFAGLSSWLSSMVMALPGIVVLLAARAVLGPSVWTSMAIFGVLMAPAYFRLVYASVVSVRSELYIDAARVSGVRDGRIISRHVLAVVRAPIVVYSAVVAGIAIGMQAGLEFLGLGGTGTASWGSMLADAFSKMYQKPVLLLWPSLAIALTCLFLALLATALRDELEGAGSGRPAHRRRNSTSPTTSPVSASIQDGATEDSAIQVHPDDGRFSTAAELLRVESLAVGYDQPDGDVVTVVRDVSLVVHQGEIHGLIGESGSGKTQTAWSVLRLLPAGGRVTGGSILFGGDDLAALKPRQMDRLRGRRIAYIPQEPMSNLDPSFTIGSQLVEPIRLQLGLSRAQAKERALDLLGKVGMKDPARAFSSYPHEISGGMAQRVLIAGAISCEPDLLIADEPTTALDVTVQAEILDLLRSLQAELGLSILVVTHNFGVVADLCDSVSVMQHGRIVERGPVRSVFAGPRHPYTQSLFAAILDEGPARGPLAAADGTPLIAEEIS
jgi:peptide/nickel transport system permease protein